MSQPTPEALALQKELSEVHGLEVRLEQHDGHKHIDLSIPAAQMDIEVDGLQHLTDPHQIIADLARTHYSDEDGYDTLRVPNALLRSHFKEIARAIAQSAHERIRHLRGTAHL